MTTLESIVPSREMCEPISHLFPESLFVWERDDKANEFHVVFRSEIGFYYHTTMYFPAPTISEMMRMAPRYSLVQRFFEKWFYQHNSFYSEAIYVTPENAWSALIAWQIEQGMLPKKEEK